MPGLLLLTGGVNLMNVADVRVPFNRIASELGTADVVLFNLEC